MAQNTQNNNLPPVNFRNILFFTDFTEQADRAFTTAVDFAMKDPSCELHLLHVIPESESQFWKTYIYEVDDVDNKARHDLDEQIQKAYISKLPEGLKLNVQFRIGRDVEEILDFAKEKNIDLIVMAKHSSSSLENAFFGAVTEKVAKKAHCAVLIVPRLKTR